MSLPLPLDYAAMEAQTAAAVPEGPGWQYEPKWDGFRALCFRDGGQVDIRSKSGQDLTRYFPELVTALKEIEPTRFVLDGEIVIPLGQSLSFDDLLQRIHPAPSRIRKLSVDTPANLIVFDLLVNEDGESLVGKPLANRREDLNAFANRYLKRNQQIRLSPATLDLEEARAWLLTMGGSLDGIIAKRTQAAYDSGERSAMLKIKNLRTADCVVGGFRYASKGGVVGSLLLGLYDDAGLLHHVGFSSGLSAAEKQDLTPKLEALVEAPGFTGNAPGGPSRWSTARSAEWQPLRTELVIEVQYDHFTGGRFRHGVRILRWRPDKEPSQCTIAQVQLESHSPLNLLSI